MFPFYFWNTWYFLNRIKIMMTTSITTTLIKSFFHTNTFWVIWKAEVPYEKIKAFIISEWKYIKTHKSTWYWKKSIWVLESDIPGQVGIPAQPLTYDFKKINIFESQFFYQKKIDIKALASRKSISRHIPKRI